MTPQSDKTEARRVAAELYRKLGRGSSQDIDAIHAALIAYGNAAAKEAEAAAHLGMAAVRDVRANVAKDAAESLGRYWAEAGLIDSESVKKRRLFVKAATACIRSAIERALPIPPTPTVEKVRRLVVACKGLRGSGAITARYPGHDRATQEWVAALSEVEALIGKPQQSKGG
jgi:hypothetical protein